MSVTYEKYGPPKEVRPPANREANNEAATTPPNTTEYIAELHRRRAASHRVEPLNCGCADPWTCRHYDDTELTEQYVDGYRDAALHLLAQGLLPAPNVPAMRVLWGRRGADQRLARTLAEQWQVVA